MISLLRFARLLTLGWLLVGPGACSGGGTGPGDSAEVQLLQADPSAPPTVAFLIDNTTVAASVAFGQSSQRIETPAGRRHFAIASFSGPLAEVEGELFAGETYYVVHAGGTLRLAEAGPLVSGGQVVPDTGQRDPARAHIRFVNVASEPTVPAVVQAHVYAPATVDSTARFGLDTRIASYGPLIYLDPGTVTVRLTPENQATLLAEETFTIGRGEVKAVVLERDSAGNLLLRIVVEQ